MIATTTLPELDRFRGAVARWLGLHFDESKRSFLEDVLNRRMEARRLTDVEGYLRLLESPEGRAEARALADLLTVPETFFFRYPAHFRVLAETVLAEHSRTPGDREVRLLSAGCASGEEPYSLAVLVREHLAAAADSWDVRIHAFDVNPQALGRAKRARYSPWSLRDTSPDIVRRYFRGDNREFCLEGGVRGMVAFEERSVADDDPGFWRPGVFDAVFFRNVMMYLVPETARAATARIARSLKPGGYLFLGHAETLRGISDDFHLRHTHGTFYYQRRDDAELRPPEGHHDAGASRALCHGPPSDCADPEAPWVDAIRQASQRVTELAERTASPGPSQSDSAAPGVCGGAGLEYHTDLGGAIELLRQERFDDALKTIRSLPPERAAKADARLLSAVLLANAGMLSEADEVCGKLLAMDEFNAGAHYITALCREHAQDLDGAIGHDQTAIYLDATLSMPHFHWGLIASRAGDVATARRELRLAARLLEREDPARVLLFGGGFSRGALVELCDSALQACGGRR